MTGEIKSASRVLDVLELFSMQDAGLTLTAVSRTLGYPKSSTLGLLRVLQARGYIGREADESYRLSDAVRHDGFSRHAHLLRVAPLPMRELSDLLGETVILGVPGPPGKVRLIAKEAANRDVRFDIELPRQEPAYCTAIGRILLTAGDGTEIERALATVPPMPLTQNTETDPARVRTRIEEARASGVAIVSDEFALGGTGVAVLVPDMPGGALAALNVGCVTSRFESQREAIIAAARDTAQRISSLLGRGKGA